MKPCARRVLLVMNPNAHRELAFLWFLRGFAASGRGFNGEIFDVEKHPALNSLLLSFFRGTYDKEHP